MYLDIAVRASSKLLFRVPHLQLPLTVKQIRKDFPDFAKEMDGSAKECTLRFFYKKDKETGIYEFIHSEDEDEVAELMKVQIMEFHEDEEVDSDGEPLKSDALTDEQMLMHKENLQEIRRGLVIINAIHSTSDSDTSDSDTSDSDTTDSDTSDSE